MKETWRWIQGFENYYKISNRGRVKSVERQVRSGTGYRTVSEKIRRPTPNQDGHLQVQLTKSGERTTRSVGRLVAEAFMEEPDGTAKLFHLDGNLRNNDVRNLRWITFSDCLLIQREGRDPAFLTNARGILSNQI